MGKQGKMTRFSQGLWSRGEADLGCRLTRSKCTYKPRRMESSGGKGTFWKRLYIRILTSFWEWCLERHSHEQGL